MSRGFAKLYGEGTDQVLVLLETNDEGEPALRFACQPPDLGVCSTWLSFPDTDAGWALAESRFEAMTEATARERIGFLHTLLNEATESEPVSTTPTGGQNR